MEIQPQPNTTISKRVFDVVLIRFFYLGVRNCFSIHFALAWHLSHISTPKVLVWCCVPTLKVGEKPPLTALPTSGDAASMMENRNPNMCEASRHASDQAFVCSYKQLMV